MLLVFNGAGAVYGGYQLITHPDGSSLQLDLQFLEDSPFNNYLIPGIVLFLLNGVCSLVVIIALLLKSRYAALLIAAQGFVLLCWIAIQMIMINIVYYLHFVMGGTGVLLLVCGLILWRNRNSELPSDNQ